MDPQTSLFADEPRGRPVQPAEFPPELKRLADRLPARVRLGTSSWSFPGWAGLVYRTPSDASVLARHGLAAYVEHPLFRTVGVDRSYYRSLEVEEWGRYAAVAPDDFRFLAKAERLLVDPGDPAFLDASVARDAVVGPFLEGLGRRAGPLLFQFPPVSPGRVGGPRAFAERLYRFLEALPSGGSYAVELRTPGLFIDDYAQALRHAGAVHGYVVHPRMPPLARQLRHLPPEGPFVARWMLRRDATYEAARDLYHPFDRLREPDPDTRATLAGAVADASASGADAFVVVNNKAEGSSPLSVNALARAVVALGPPGSQAEAISSRKAAP